MVSTILESHIVTAARVYAQTRQACPFPGFEAKIEDAGWKLAEMVREFDAQNARFNDLVARGEYCPVCHHNPNMSGHGPRCRKFA